MRIGIDFDNTIADYRHAFARVARDSGLVGDDFTGDKPTLRTLLRARPGGETDWQKLQGQVYGRHIGLARVMPGLDGFMSASILKGADIYIVSHKTEYGHHDPARINLHDAATGWLGEHGFFDADGYGVDPDNVFYRATRETKIDTIRALSLDHFIDDLEEVLCDTEFPPATRGHLLRAGQEDGRTTSNWHEIREAVFGP